GNVPADLTKNDLPPNLLESRQEPTRSREIQAWLGEAIAIQDPTAAVFRSQSGNNLLLVGQQGEAALGILTAALLSLAAQIPPASGEDPGSPVRFYVLDGSSQAEPQAGFLARLGAGLPHAAKVADARVLGPLIEELASEVERRQAAQHCDAPAVFLFIYGLQRCRDLRKQEDDFGFSRRGEEKPNPAKQFAQILRDGPSCGVHTLVWC